MSIIVNVLRDELARTKRMLAAYEKEEASEVCKTLRTEQEMIEKMIALAESEYPQMV